MERTTWEPTAIVVGVDGSEQSSNAAALAAAMARRTGARVHLMTVVRPPEGWWGIVGSPPTSTALGNTLTEARREILDAMLTTVDFGGVDYELVEDIGDPARMLVDYAAGVDADLIVIGQRGAGLLERMVLGSVANRVVHDARCPVLIVP